MSERDLDAEDVRREHLKDVNARAHAVYLASVLLGSTLLMLGLLVVLDAIS